MKRSKTKYLPTVSAYKVRAMQCLNVYGNFKCPKISNTKISDKMAYANSVDPDQIAPEGAI